MFWSTVLNVTLRRQDFLQQISQGDAESVAAMLQANPDLANKTHGSRFPLDVAVCCGLANIVQLLIDSGDLKHIHNALSAAFVSRWWWLRTGADANATSPLMPAAPTPLHIASMSGAPAEMVRILLRAGDEPHAPLNALALRRLCRL